MKWMVRLYPAKWRERYGEEFADVLASQRPSLGMLVDVLGGAVDAHLRPQARVVKTEPVQGDDTMTRELIGRCAAGGPKLSARDQKIASIGMIVSALVTSGAYVILTKLYHSAVPVQALGYTSFPAMMLVYTQMAYWRGRSKAAQAVLLVGSFAFIYLIMLGACAVAVKL